MINRQPTLFESDRISFDEAMQMTADSLNAYGERYRHWAIAYSGGNDSSAVVTATLHLIETGAVRAPETLWVLYADTRMELPPLQSAAMNLLREIGSRGVKTQIVLPQMDERFFVYMLGRGVPPPKNRFRWCTSQIKIEPMLAAMAELRASIGEKMLMLTGVRLGESAARDARIALSCSRDGAECGQGWFQLSTPESVADTLAPILHWRVCQVWDWLMLYGTTHRFTTAQVALAYGGDEALEINARTGCVGCNLTSRDLALDTILENPEWDHLRPLKRLRLLYAELIKPHNRLRKDGSERRKDGSLVSNPMRMGPLTFEARRMALAEVEAIQGEVCDGARRGNGVGIDLINAEEKARILELIDAGTWPNGWDGSEVTGDVLLEETMPDGSVQPNLLFGQ